MGRRPGKLIPKFIEVPKTRKSTYTNRCMGLKKKVMEFSILCNVDACLISFGKDGELETWPEDQSKLNQVIHRYESVAKNEREKNMENLSSYINKSNTTLEEELTKTRQVNVESKRELLQLLEEKMQQVRERMEYLNSCATGGFPEPNYHQNFSHPVDAYSNPSHEDWVLDHQTKLMFDSLLNQPLPLQTLEAPTYGNEEAVPQLEWPMLTDSEIGCSTTYNNTNEDQLSFFQTYNNNADSMSFLQSCNSEFNMLYQPGPFEDMILELPPQTPFDNGELAFRFANQV